METPRDKRSKELYVVRRELKRLTVLVTMFLTRLDALMQATPIPYKQIAKLCNELELANDSVMRFTLKMSFKKIIDLKKQ